MKWILIIFMWSYHGTAITTQEFTTMQRCQEAKRAVNGGYGRFDIKSFCVKK